jgi:hypothetical protein
VSIGVGGGSISGESHGLSDAAKNLFGRVLKTNNSNNDDLVNFFIGLNLK